MNLPTLSAAKSLIQESLFPYIKGNESYLVGGALFLTALTCYAAYKKYFNPTVQVHSTQDEINITVKKQPGQLTQDEIVALIAGIKRWRGPNGYQFTWDGLSSRTPKLFNLLILSGGTLNMQVPLRTDGLFYFCAIPEHYFAIKVTDSTNPLAIDDLLARIFAFYQVNPRLIN